jgi:spore maturation protein CgeB
MIRFLKATTNYTQYILGFAKKHPEINTLPYDQGLKLYFSDCNAWADYWKINLESTGRFVCAEVIENHELLQKKWANEHGVAYREDSWQRDVLIAQIAEFKPDVLFLVDQYNDNGIARDIRQLVPGIRLVIGWDGILWHKPKTYEFSDIVVSCVPETVEFYKRLGKPAYYHRFAFEPSILGRLHEFQKKLPVTFSGSLVLSENYHLGRLGLVAAVNRRTPMEIRASGMPRDWNIFSLANIKSLLRGANLRRALDIHRIGSRNRGEAFGIEMFNLLFNSRIVFNTHGDNSPKHAANMRMTEATGVGSLLLTDWKENLHTLFKPEEEVVTYRTSAEAIDKIRQLLKNEPLRRRIADAGQKRTLSEHTYRNRMEEFASFLYHYL